MSQRIPRYIMERCKGKRLDEKIYTLGRCYNQTAGLSMSLLSRFIRRDILRAIKAGRFPKMKIKVKAYRRHSKNFLKVFVQEVSGDILNNDFIKGQVQSGKPFKLSDGFFKSNYHEAYTALGKVIKLEIAKILWRYNWESFQVIDGEMQSTGKRFFSSVEYPLVYTSYLLRTVLGVPREVGSKIKYLVYGRGRKAS